MKNARNWFGTLLLTLALPAALPAAEIAWTNSAGGNWNIAANWNPNQVPGAADFARITNGGVYAITNSADVTVGGLALGSTAGAQTLRLTAGTLTVTNFTATSPSVMALVGGSLTAAGSFSSAGQLNQNGGVWRLLAAASVNTFNFTNGELRGGTLTVTNCTWVNGNMNADANGDKTIIPPGGVLNFIGAATRYFSYNSPATSGRGLDNYGTWNWSGDATLYGLQAACVVNNHGTVNHTGTGDAYFAYYPGYGAPTWNNFGTFTKSGGANFFYWYGVYINNHGTMDIQSGKLSSYASVATNHADMTLSTNAIFQTDAGGTFTFNPTSSLTSPGGNAVRVNSGTVYVQTTNVNASSIWIAGGTLWHQTNNTIPTINQASGAWRLSVNTTVNTYNLTNGELRGGTLTVTNLTWLNGNMNADANGDKTIIPPGGVLDFPGNATRQLSYNAGATRGRDIDNHGTWNWTGDSLLYGINPAVVNNYGTVIHTGGAGNAQFLYYPSYASPTWNNFGTFTKPAGAGSFYFNGVYLNNSSAITAQAGLLSFYGSAVNNNGPINVQNATFQAFASTTTNTAAITLDANSFFTMDNSGTFVFEPTSSLNSPGFNRVILSAGTVMLRSTNIVSPSMWIAGGTLWHQTNNTIPTINESAGAWRLSVATTVNTYNLTNGELRGGTLTVTNLTWINGNMNADLNGDKTIIPPGGVLNFPGNATRQLSYNAGATRGRDLDNHGTWNWTGDSLLYGINPAVVNNYGTVIVISSGAAQYLYYPGYAAPAWNNFGTFTKATGTGPFYFQGVYLNNSGAMNAQSGTLSFYGSTVINNGPINVQNATLQAYASTTTNTAAITLDANSFFTMDNSGTFVFEPTSSMSSPGFNRVVLNAGTVMLRSTNIVSPSVWIAGGTLWHQTNNTIPIINESTGTWRLTGATTVSTYNLTNGELRGGTLTVTNLNWINGQMNADATGDKTIIPTNGVLTMTGTATRYLSYYPSAAHGRDLDNFGTWNWADNSTLIGVNPAVVNNYGQLNVTGTGSGATYSQFSYNSGYSAPVWNNYGTLTKTGGTNSLYFTATYVNNSGTIDLQSGILRLHAGTTTNLNGGVISLGAGAQLVNENGNSFTLNPGSYFSAASANAFQIPSGTVYLRSSGLTLPSLWISGGTLLQEAANVVPQVNQSAGLWRLNTPISVNTYNFTNGELRGADLTIDTFNWLGGSLNADGSGSNLVTVASALNISGNTTKTLSYYTQPGRSLINNGVATWGGVGITGQGAAAIRNNGSMTATNDVGLVWGGAGAVSVFDNVGSYTKSGGSGTAAFGSTVFTNSGTFAVNSGGISFASLYQTAGSTHLGTNFSAAGNVRIEAGTLTGQGNIAGYLYNNGTLNPGASPGLITGGLFTNSAIASLNIELGGTSGPGINYDQFSLTGAASLSGTLNVTLANNFAPQLSNSFTVLRFASRSGTFPTLIPPPGVTLQADYSTTNLVLTVTAMTNAPLQITSFPANQTVYQTDPVNFFVGVSGTTPISYQWQFNSNNIANATNAGYAIAATVLTNAGTYAVLITDGVGATTNAAATLTVLPFDGTIYWTNVAGGNWSVAANWLPNRVPGPTNTAVISSNGNYLVTINAAASVNNLIVGSASNTSTQAVHLPGNQSLTLGGNSFFATNTVLHLDGALQTSGGSNYFGGLVNWYTGTLLGAGRTVVGTNGNLYFICSQAQKHIVTNIVENYGSWTTSPDAGIGPGQLPRFSGGAQLTNHLSGVINMGANALNYAGAQTTRSYLVNHGKVIAATTSVWSPSTIGIDFLNYGLLENYSYVYIARGQNFGTMWGYNGLTQISIFGDPTSGEYFSFEPSTVFSGIGPNIACGGLVQWNAPNTIHAGSLGIGQGSGGATYANAEFKIIANYTNTAALHINRGALTITDPAIITDLRSYGDSFVSFWSFGVTNAGTMYVDNFSHVIYGFGNGGTLVIRTNGGFAGGSLYGGGNVIITPSATATFSGMGVDAQLIENFGNTVVTVGTHLTGNSHFENHTDRPIYFGGGDFRTGPATLANHGAINGFGGIYVTATNHNLVTANDPLNRTLALGDYWQATGATQLRGGNFSGTINVLGGTLDGAGNVGTVINGAHVLPGNPLGNINATGNYTNLASGTYHLQIGATNNYDRINVAGTAQLAGTLNVLFTNGFYPVIGNTFTAMTYTARSGVFNQVLLPGYDFEVIYTPTSLLLRASNALPVVNFSVSGGNTQWVCQPFELSASATDPDGVVTNISFYMNNSLIGSYAGSSASLTVESDFPATNSFTARATDDRSGIRSTNNEVALVTAPLHLLSLGGMRTNGFKICMLGEAGSNYLVFATTNLNQPYNDWVNLGTMERTNGIWRHIDAGITNLPRRFYRAEQY